MSGGGAIAAEALNAAGQFANLIPVGGPIVGAALKVAGGVVRTFDGESDSERRQREAKNKAAVKAAEDAPPPKGLRLAGAKKMASPLDFDLDVTEDAPRVGGDDDSDGEYSRASSSDVPDSELGEDESEYSADDISEGEVSGPLGEKGRRAYPGDDGEDKPAEPDVTKLAPRGKVRTPEMPSGSPARARKVPPPGLAKALESARALVSFLESFQGGQDAPAEAPQAPQGPQGYQPSEGEVVARTVGKVVEGLSPLITLYGRR